MSLLEDEQQPVLLPFPESGPTIKTLTYTFTDL